MPRADTLDLEILYDASYGIDGLCLSSERDYVYIYRGVYEDKGVYIVDRETRERRYIEGGWGPRFKMPQAITLIPPQPGVKDNVWEVYE